MTTQRPRTATKPTHVVSPDGPTPQNGTQGDFDEREADPFAAADAYIDGRTTDLECIPGLGDVLRAAWQRLKPAIAQNIASTIAAISGADTELDYYGGA